MLPIDIRGAMMAFKLFWLGHWMHPAWSQNLPRCKREEVLGAIQSELARIRQEQEAGGEMPGLNALSCAIVRARSYGLSIFLLYPIPPTCPKRYTVGSLKSLSEESIEDLGRR